jgi:hypothetical protein
MNPTITIKARKISWDRYAWAADPNDEIRFGQKRVSSLDVEYSSDEKDPFFAFFAEDCMDPAIHVIRARSFEAAYEVFIDQEADRGHYVIDEGDPDYGPDDGFYSNSGFRVDTECFRGFQLPSPTIEVA